jgi:16S rRNA A1518/A1519 N6-dimethyltransferase RsmA/KsgA/DIM1 with predicted DNA glycosylase/AP lyase activity
MKKKNDPKKKVSREAFEKFYKASFGNNRKHVKEALLSEFGIEVEEVADKKEER